MFYTKYRLQKFSEVIRPSDAAEILSKQVKSGKTVHAYLFVGPRGTGKTTIARILAKTLNCSKPMSNGDPCGKCKNCISIKEGSFVDLIEIDAASNRGIDDIRDLKDKVRLAPSMGKHKVYIVDEVHMLTIEAFNALLKTLEEPPRNTTFILCTTEDHKVPATIKSRCQVFKFKKASVTQLVSSLEGIVEEEKIKISKADLKKIAEAAAGDYRGASVLLQQVVDGEIDTNTLLSISSRGKYIDCVNYLYNREPKEALGIINAVSIEGVDFYLWAGELIKHLRDVILIKSGASDNELDITEEVLEEVKSQANILDLPWLISATNILIEAHKNIKGSFIPQLPVELAIVEICSHGDSHTPNLPVEPEKPKNDKDEVKSEAETAPVSEKKKSSKINLSKVKNKWTDFVEKSKDLNHSLTVLLRSAKLVDVDGDFVVLEVFYPFHKERIESPRCRKILEDLSESVYGSRMSFKCSVSKEKPKNLKKGETGVLTDLNIAVPASVDRDTLLEAFDGGLPIVG